jgi:hypothetical protein
MVNLKQDMKSGVMKFKLFDFFTQYDYGREIYFTIGQFENFNIIDAQFHSSSYWDWEPNIRLTLSVFDGSIFSFGIGVLSFSFSMSFIPYRCPMNLSHTREL